MKKRIGIIGFGAFGQFISRILKKDFDIIVRSYSKTDRKARQIGVEIGNLREVAESDVIIISVPMRDFSKVLEEIKYFVKPNTLVIDVCSLKVFSVKEMKKILGKRCQLVASHPLFGPNSVSSGLAGKKIFLHNINSKYYEDVKKYCRKIGLKILEGSPENHDKQMAESQVLVNFIGRAVADMNVKIPEMAPASFEQFMSVMQIFKNHSKELFEDIQNFNPYSRKVRKRFLDSAKKIDRNLK